MRNRIALLTLPALLLALAVTAFLAQRPAPAFAQGSLYPLQVGDVHWRAPVAGQSALPSGANAAVTGGNALADVRVSQDFFDLFVWTGTAWKKSYARSGVHGESSTPFLLWEHLTLSTSGVTTTGAGNLLPANSLIDHVDCVTTVTVTGSGVTGLQIGDGTTVDRFASAGALGLTAGSKAVGWNVRRPAYATTDAKGPTQAALAQVVVTAVGGTPTAGAVSCSSFGSTVTPPAS
jgi:hypothetical protein